MGGVTLSRFKQTSARRYVGHRHRGASQPLCLSRYSFPFTWNIEIFVSQTSLPFLPSPCARPALTLDFFPSRVLQYDLSTTTYSPDGKVFQVEYAGKAVDNGG